MGRGLLWADGESSAARVFAIRIRIECVQETSINDRERLCFLGLEASLSIQSKLNKTELNAYRARVKVIHTNLSPHCIPGACFCLIRRAGMIDSDDLS